MQRIEQHTAQDIMVVPSPSLLIISRCIFLSNLELSTVSVILEPALPIVVFPLSTPCLASNDTFTSFPLPCQWWYLHFLYLALPIMIPSLAFPFLANNDIFACLPLPKMIFLALPCRNPCYYLLLHLSCNSWPPSPRRFGRKVGYHCTVMRHFIRNGCFLTGII